MGSIKQALKAKIAREGAGRKPELLKAVDDMSEGAAQEMWRFIQTLEGNAKRDGRRDGARQPWRR